VTTQNERHPALRDGARVRLADPLALDPYAPLPDTGAQEREDAAARHADALALDPYSPIDLT
jgi:hypothetical protein